jgi:hypothetical protein
MDQRGKTPDRQKKNPVSVHVGFVVDVVTLGHFGFPPVNFIPPALHDTEKLKK